MDKAILKALTLAAALGLQAGVAQADTIDATDGVQISQDDAAQAQSTDTDESMIIIADDPLKRAGDGRCMTDL